MTNILEFKPRKQTSRAPANHLISISIFQHDDGMLEVDAEVNPDATDYDVFEAIMAAAWKYAEDTDLITGE